MGVSMKRDDLPKLLAAVKLLTRRQCLVGVSDKTAARDPEPGESSDINNATLAYIHEFGSPAQNIPARPFLFPGIENAKPQIVDLLKKAGAKALGGDIAEIDRVLNAVGIIAVDAIQQKIEDGPFAPLKPGTLAARRRRGVTRTKPLIDTAAMQASITYVIRDK